MSRKISNEVRLELGLLDDERSKPSEREQSRKPGAPSLLIVDDDPDMRTFVRACLRRLQRPLGSILEAEDGQAALALLNEQSFDLVISDLVMPRLGGAELCRSLRADPELRHTRVLLMSGERSEPELREQVRDADAVILKPFNARQLCEQVIRLLERGPPAANS